MAEPMTDERVAALWGLVRAPQAHGFRSECAELLREVERLRGDNADLRSIAVVGDWGPECVADRCEAVARRCDSSLHEAAGLMIRRLRRENAELADAAADARAKKVVYVR